MSPAEIHRLLLNRFGDKAILGFDDAALDPGVEVAAARIAEVGEFLLTHEQCQFNHLNDLCGVDYLELDPKKAKKFDYPPHLEVVYHLSSFTLKHRFKLRVKLPRWQNDQPGELPEVPTVSGVWKIADWHEREAYDLMGIHFIGHPNPRRILCPEDWVGHPLRKDYEFPLEYHGIRGK